MPTIKVCPDFLYNPVLIGVGNTDSGDEGQLFPFTITSRHRLSNLPPPFRDGIQDSKLYKEEIDCGGLAVTRAISLWLPTTGHEDAIFQARISYMNAFILSDLLGFGDPATAEEVENHNKEILRPT